MRKYIQPIYVPGLTLQPCETVASEFDPKWQFSHFIRP